MKLLLVNPNTSIAITEAMLAIARDAAAQGVLIEGLTARFGAPLIVDPATLLVAEQAVPDIVLQHIDETFSGVIVSAFGDPGVIALRQMLEIPVTGIAEASMLEAAAYGRFSIVTTTPELIGSIEAAARRYGHAAALVSIRTTAGDPAQLTAQPAALEHALYEACLLATAIDHAQSIIIGGGPLATAARRLSTRIPAPLIEPVPAAVRLAISRCRIQQPPTASGKSAAGSEQRTQ